MGSMHGQALTVGPFQVKSFELEAELVNAALAIS